MLTSVLPRLAWSARWYALLAAICLTAPTAVAQTGSPTAQTALGATQWQTGTVNVLAGWREHDGDDPSWARPDFDDSGWQQVDLDDLGPAEPGWRWYRLRVKLAPGHEHLHLLIAGGEGAYEAWINGVRQEDVGLSWLASTRPTEQVFPLDDQATDLTIALRTYGNSNYTTWHLPLFLTAAIGTPGAITNEQQALEAGRLYAAVPAVAINLVVILAAIGVFALFRSQRKHREYLWLGFYLLALGASNLLLACTVNGVLPLVWNNLVADPLIYLFTIMQIEFTFSFAGKQVGRAWRLYEVALLLPLGMAALLYTGFVSATAYLIVEALVILPAAVILPVLLLVWYRRGNHEAGWLILPSLLPTATTALFDLGSASQFTGLGGFEFLENPVYFGRIPLQPADLANLLYVFAIAVVMFLRFTRVSREQARTAAELSAARDIQRRLVPETLPGVEGYAVEAAYFPAEEIGGDFYQLLETDGATLVVVGDVSGKGLKAAMTSTLALGAVRALASEGHGPAALLSRLNRQLARSGSEGFVTCLCARITPQGEVRLANAGHLPPYWNGVEMVLEPGLPLGLAEEANYGEYSFALEEGDRLMLLSDGVVEARDARGELFGFERTGAISGETANAIAEAALRYGQADDITVLTLTRAGIRKTAVAAETGVVLG